MRMIRNSILLTILAGLLSLGVQAQSAEIAIKNSAFSPQTLTIQVGTNVTWINYDTMSQTVTSEKGAFDSGSIKNGARFVYQFSNPGTYKYHNKIYPNINGTIIVTSKSASQKQNMTSPPAKMNASKSAAAQYSEYFSNITRKVPAAHISAPKEYNVTNNPPNVIYFAQKQAVPYSTYQSNPTYNSSNSLWVKGKTSWTQYAAVPFGTIVSLVVVSPTGGSGYLTDVEPNGLKYSQNFFFYPDSQQTFYANKIGRHKLKFTIGNQVSNPVVIDVIGNPYLDYYYGLPYDYIAAEEGESAIEEAEAIPVFGGGADTRVTASEAQAGEAAL